MTALLLACGALAREVLALQARHGWDAEVQALPAGLHNRPARIPGEVERRVESSSRSFQPVVVIYGDCGTGGRLQEMLERRGWHGLSAPHCYALYAGDRAFDRMMEAEPGTFFLTDYLVRSFDHLVIEGLGLDQHPELRDAYFGRYRRAVYLQQRRDPALLEQARIAALAIDLPLEVRYTGLRGLESKLVPLLGSGKPIAESTSSR